MRYFVTIGDKELEVELGSGGIWVDGEELLADLVEMDGTQVHSLLLGKKSHRILAARNGTEEWTLHLSGRHLRAQVVDELTRGIRELTAVKERRRGPKALRAPMPGLVIQVDAQEGDEVVQGQGLVIVEAMKMENELKSEGKGKISRILVEPGEIVQKDQLLMEFELPEDSREGGSEE
jgi:pyruvate carboxylase subunit B